LNFAANTGCGAIASCSYPDGSGTPDHLKFAGGATAATATVFGDFSTSGSVVFHLGAVSGCPCYYTFNSISMSGQSQMVIDGGPVFINVAGQGANTAL